MASSIRWRIWERAALIVALVALPAAAHGQASEPRAALATSPQSAAVQSAAPSPGVARSHEANSLKAIPGAPKATTTPVKAVWNFLNSEFVAALIAGIVGAGVGAYGGAWIVRRQQERRAAREEVRAVNVAVANVLFILNWTIALKRQHVRGMTTKYKADCHRREALLKLPGPQVLDFTMEMQTIPLVELPMPPLRAMVYDRLDAPGTAYAMCATLTSSLDALLSATQQRNDLIEEVRRGPQMTDLERSAFYFGLTRPDGVQDARYPTMLEAISHYSDATILYSMIMAALLIEHGKGVAQTFGKKKPNVTSMNISVVFTDELVPNLEEYKDMLQNLGIDALALLSKYGAPPPGPETELPVVPGV
jgi:hypothetical protein